MDDDKNLSLGELLTALTESLEGLRDADLGPERLANLEAIVTEAELKVDPPLAPLLAFKRLVRAKVVEWMATGIEPAKIRSGVVEMIRESLPGFPAEQRIIFESMILTVLDEEGV